MFKSKKQTKIVLEKIFENHGQTDEPRHEKTGFLHMPKQRRRSASLYREADQHLCFPYIVQSLYFLHTKFQASSHLVWLYSRFCVGPGRKPGRPVFSQRGSDDNGRMQDDMPEVSGELKKPQK